MATKETAAPEPEKVVEAPEPAEAAKAEEAQPPPEVATPTDAPPADFIPLADVVLRFLLFASALVAVVVMATSDQTKNASPPAKFRHSPALIYFVAALSVAGLYSIITSFLSLFALLKLPGSCPNVLSLFVIFDVLLLGIVAAATGSAATFGYIGLKGNSHVGWNKVCGTYDVFCKHIAASVAVSLFASIVLAVLVLLSVCSLSKKVPK